jgi:hypothetical protein
MTSLPVRLLSSVAVVGRDNEPIYLRGDLCDATTQSLDKIILDDNEFDADETSVHDADAASVQDADAPKQHQNRVQDSSSGEKPDEDPFGFFTENSHSMSLTNQLVLHASLDRFEEMARSSTGMVRWRMPGSNGANAMWMGLLCEVEERWNVYGEYLASDAWNECITWCCVLNALPLSLSGYLIRISNKHRNQIHAYRRECTIKRRWNTN